MTFLLTGSFAQEPTPSPSGATKPSDTEIKRVLVRALDKVEAQNDEIKAKDAVIVSKDEVIAEQDKAHTKTLNAAELYRQAAEANKDAFLQQQKATISAEEGWKRENQRVRDLEKKLKNSRTVTKFAVVAGIAAAVTLYLLK